MSRDLEAALEKALRDSVHGRSFGLFRSIHAAIRRILRGAKAPPPSEALGHGALVRRIHSLPAHTQKLLQRYYVFNEAEDRICSSANLSVGEFRKLIREARNYILERREGEFPGKPGERID